MPSLAGTGRLKVVRSAISVIAAALFLIAGNGFAQQEASGKDESAKPSEEIHSREVPVPPPRPRNLEPNSSPETMAVRGDLAKALNGAVSFPNAIPTPPPGTWGITSEGTGGGGIFRDSDSEAEAWLGVAGVGVTGYGSDIGGYFGRSDNSGYAYIGTVSVGIVAYGDIAGGSFWDIDDSGYANVGAGERGISAYGNDWGAYFEDLDQSGRAYLGYGHRGIEAAGNEMGGHFSDFNQSGYAEVGVEDIGIRGYGDLVGGYFKDDGQSGRSWVGTEDYGIKGFGDFAGGNFEDTNSSSYGRVGYDTYKIYGTGAVSFVQNHPYDPSSVIVYAAPEGDEVATYTRGAARLIGGEATVSLGNTFKWVTNPDVGLTTFLTPVSEWCDLYVAGQATDEIVVRSRDGSDCDFNYMVYGLRIGFEESSIIREKEREAYIPSMSGHRQLYQRRPELQVFSSLERFKGMRHAMGQKDALDLSRAQALRDAIVEFDPAVHELQIPLMEENSRPGHIGDEDVLGRKESGAKVRTVRPDHGSRRAPSSTDLSAAIPVDDKGNLCAQSFQPSSREVTSLVDVSESVEPGDVLVIDRASAGKMRRGFEGHDPGVIGVVSENTGMVMGSQSPALTDEEAGAEVAHRAEVAMAGAVSCKVDAAFGAIWPGDLLVTSPTPGHAMRTESPLPGTIVGKALEPLDEGTGLIRVLVMLR
jgi:hypothetical protein